MATTSNTINNATNHTSILGNVIKTIYHSFKFDTRIPEEKQAYEELDAKLKGQGLECFESHGGGSHYNPKLNGLTLELEIKHLFNNQWNTAAIAGVSDKGLRVFDWAMDYQISSTWCKQGHYLEQTVEMREVRQQTVACRYCGKQESIAKGLVFCVECIDSEYLQVKDLHLLRMKPICDSDKPREELTDREREYLLPLYKEAQIHGSTKRGKARIEKKRRDVVEKANKAVENATKERDGLLWLLDHGVNTDNVIYYSHTGRFCFGWRGDRVLDKEVKEEMLKALAEFPYAFDVK